MLALTWPQALSTFLFLVVCVMLILLILIQKGRGGGLSGAFGGVGSYSPFGTKTGDALTWATVILTGMDLLIAVLANYAYRPSTPNLGSSLNSPTSATQPSADVVKTEQVPVPVTATENNAPAPESSAPTTPPASPASQPSGQ
jgi:preprotein translocase subunit SecG